MSKNPINYNWLGKYYTYFVEAGNTACINISTEKNAFNKGREYSMIYGTADIYGRDYDTDLPYMIARARNGRVYRLKERI